MQSLSGLQRHVRHAIPGARRGSGQVRHIRPLPGQGRVRLARSLGIGPAGSLLTAGVITDRDPRLSASPGSDATRLM